MDLINNVEYVLHNLNINEYRILLHSLHKYTVLLQAGSIIKTETVNDRWLQLLCIANEKLTYLTFPICAPDVFRILLSSCLAHNVQDGNTASIDLSLLPQVAKEATPSVFSEKEHLKHIYNEEEWAKDSGYNILSTQHIHLKHTISAKTATTRCTSEIVENQVLLSAWLEGGVQSVYADSTLTAVSYRELINRLGKPLNVEDLQLSEKTLSGIIFLPADVFQFFCLYLITSLNGSLILSGQSFLKKQDLGKKVFTSHLSIYDSPQMKYPYATLDAEGSPLVEKELINHGYFNEALCDVVSAAELGCSAGNAFYNAQQMSVAVIPSVVKLLFNDVDSFDYDMNRSCDVRHIEAILPPGVQFNFSTGVISGMFVGRDMISGTKYAYPFHQHIATFFNSIVGTDLKERYIDGFILPGVFLRL